MTIFFLIYAGDIIITSSSLLAIFTLIQFLKIEFAVKELGDLNFFLGVEVIKNVRTYVVHVLRTYVMILCSSLIF